MRNREGNRLEQRKGDITKRVIGNSLVAVGVLLMVITVLGVIAAIADIPDSLNEDQRLAGIAGLLFAGVLLILETLMLLAGLHLRHPLCAELAEAAVRTGSVRRGPLALYLGATIAVALLAAFLRMMPEFLRPVWLLIGQPFVFTQLLFGGLLGVKLDPGIKTQAIMVTTNLLYFLLLFYPLYRILTIDRTVQAACYRRMKTLAILLVTVHLLITGAFAVLVKA